MKTSFTQHSADSSIATNPHSTQASDIYNPQIAARLVGELAQPDSLSAQLQEELQNPLSLWQELRVTAMSGTDYVFIPSFVYQAFGPTYSITRFFSELSCAFNLEVSRLQMICIREENDERTFSKGVIEWGNGSITHSHEEAIIVNSSYSNFIESMYQHSTALVNQPEH